MVAVFAAQRRHAERGIPGKRPRMRRQMLGRAEFQG
jgi:hypothetical protein